MCIILIWNVSATYHLLFLRLKQNVFPRYCDILYLHFIFRYIYTFFKETFFCFSDTLCSHLFTCSCCLLKLSPSTQISQNDEMGKAANSAFRNTVQKYRSEKLRGRTNKARKLWEGSFAFHHSWHFWFCRSASSTESNFTWLSSDYKPLLKVTLPSWVVLLNLKEIATELS